MGRVKEAGDDTTHAPPEMWSVRARYVFAGGEVGCVVIVAVRGFYLWWFGDEKRLIDWDRKERQRYEIEGEKKWW